MRARLQKSQSVVKFGLYMRVTDRVWQRGADRMMMSNLCVSGGGEKWHRLL